MCLTFNPYLSYSLKSLKGGYIGDYIGDYYRGYYGDTRSLDYGSYNPSEVMKFSLYGAPKPTLF